jgi:hypothetical protein
MLVYRLCRARPSPRHGSRHEERAGPAPVYSEGLPYEQEVFAGTGIPTEA